MARRRKTTCLLVLLFTLAMTVFMLIYPGLIKSTRLRLEEAYESIEVKGWILNAESYSDPLIPGETWKALRDSGYFRDCAAYQRFSFHLCPKEQLEAAAGKDADEAQQLRAAQVLLQGERSGESGTMAAYNRFQASDALMRVRDKITWLEGYDESCLEGDERVCILSDQFGYEPGDVVPLLAVRMREKDRSNQCGFFRMKVVATYHGHLTDLEAAMPLETYEALCVTATEVQRKLGDNEAWPFTLRSLLFTVEDNHKLDELKDYLLGLGLAGSNGLRAVLDDRVLRGTTSPIESNLALLENLYAFFFAMVVVIGFFISFLLARGRKAEYAVMRLLGESRAQITLKALLEQFLLCLLGVIFGAGAVGILEKNSFNMGICLIILLCYTVGAAAAMILTIRVNVMDLLRDKE